MSTLASDTEENHYAERTEDAARFYASSRMVFPPSGSDSKPSHLEIRLYQTKVEEGRDELEKLLLPLEVLLVDETSDMRYEDCYYYTCCGSFMNHGWRKYNKEKGSYEDENGKPLVDKDGKPLDQFHFDRDEGKLFERGETIRKMLREKSFSLALERNPTVQKLKTHTLWKS